jgi:hypothetical protein
MAGNAQLCWVVAQRCDMADGPRPLSVGKWMRCGPAVPPRASDASPGQELNNCRVLSYRPESTRLIHENPRSHPYRARSETMPLRNNLRMMLEGSSI